MFTQLVMEAIGVIGDTLSLARNITRDSKITHERCVIRNPTETTPLCYVQSTMAEAKMQQ